LYLQANVSSIPRRDRGAGSSQFVLCLRNRKSEFNREVLSKGRGIFCLFICLKSRLGMSGAYHVCQVFVLGVVLRDRSGVGVCGWTEL
jgi:hypothetical protein